MMDLLSDEMRRNPYPVYEAMRSGSPLLHAEQFGFWLIFDYESVKWVLNDHDAFSSNVSPPGSQPARWLVFSDPPRHTKLRALVTRAFTPRVIANLEPRIRELSRELLDQTIERGEMDLAEDFAVPLPMMVIAEMLGIPFSDRPRFKSWGDAIINLSGTIMGGEAAVRATEAYMAVKTEMNGYITDLIERRRAEPKDDLLTRLVEAQVDGERLGVEELTGFFQLLLAAGTETTTNLINNALLCFIEHPDQLARLRAEPERLPAAIEEVLRYRSPVQVMFRATKRDVELHGQVIPAGKLLFTMIGSANRDPKQFRNAERFDITREPNPHIAFGHGIHFCLGAALSRLEARVALTEFLERVKDFQLASNEPWVPRQSFHVHGPTRLPLRFEPGRRSMTPA